MQACSSRPAHSLFGFATLALPPLGKSLQVQSAPELNNWYTLTGRVVALKVEADGDLHIALQDATGNKPGLACNSLMNELHQCLVFERFCKEAESSRIECGLAH